MGSVRSRTSNLRYAAISNRSPEAARLHCNTAPEPAQAAYPAILPDHRATGNGATGHSLVPLNRSQCILGNADNMDRQNFAQMIRRACLVLTAAAALPVSICLHAQQSSMVILRSNGRRTSQGKGKAGRNGETRRIATQAGRIPARPQNSSSSTVLLVLPSCSRIASL